MPGHSTGTNHKTRPHSSSRSRADGYRQNRTYSRDSSTSQETCKENYSEQPRSIDSQFPRKTHPHYANGRGSETLGFIPGSADSPQGTQACGSCASLGWSGCKALLCCILTCGLYGSRKPCLPPNESSTDKPEPEPRKPNGLALTNPTCGVTYEPSKPKLPNSGSFRYGDVYLAGKKVDYPANSEAHPRRTRTAGKGDNQRPISNTSIYSREDLDLDDLDDSGTDIDSLITKKLLELYKMHQIEQLAKCTSDVSFSRKTNEISDLINSIAQDYNLEEQEAECRLVHGVIRISTRNKSKGYKSKDYKSHDAMQHTNGRVDGTLPDSGNETMPFTLSGDPEVLVSELTPSDELARNMRGHSGKNYYSSSATDSSGAPLLR
ncbi:keratinocyte differentiation factor 1 [Pimephales promelas]|uniref:keratinocyte differentiation factor 1 n=1 Tax=Pimephales promelas TaxID=90988 RepID=UPI001955BB15|nr:keratinocyte differentiation factor 1 [Pimephales promelas]KAG1932374.1 keratinocyte differentiation factor [Pimephales promelas]